MRAIEWEQRLGKTDAFPFIGWSLNSVLLSVPDCQSIIKKAIVTRLSERYQIVWFEESGSTVQVQFSIMKDLNRGIAPILLLDDVFDKLDKIVNK